jgi:isoquinoline 1-oxidoreductase alpha subunit
MDGREAGYDYRNPVPVNQRPMIPIVLEINRRTYSVDIPESMPLLWVLRDKLDLTGTKFGCGKGLCGACTVMINGSAMRSCTFPVAAAAGMSITTIEGLDPAGQHPVQRAWHELDVPQCGYCQGGQMLCAASLLKQNPRPDDAAIDAALAGNICRCGTYPRIRNAVKLAADYTATAGGTA